MLIEEKRAKVTMELQGLTHGLKRYLESLVEGEVVSMVPPKTVSGANVVILLYLYDNQDKDVFQKDLEERLNVRRSTISKVLKIMEEKGMVQREAVEHDARLKKILITKETQKMIEEFKKKYRTVESTLFSNFSDEELDQFFYLIHKAKQNLKRTKKGNIC